MEFGAEYTFSNPDQFWSGESALSHLAEERFERRSFRWSGAARLEQSTTPGRQEANY